MDIVLFDGDKRERLLPLVYMMPVGELRMGICTFQERWQESSSMSVSFETAAYLQNLYPSSTDSQHLFIKGNLLADQGLTTAILALSQNQGLSYKGEIIAANLSAASFDSNLVKETVEWSAETILVEQPADLFRYNSEALHIDYKRKTEGKKSEAIHDSVTVLGNDLFIAPAAKLRACIINTETGPVYIDEDAEIMEGSVVRGPFYLGKHAGLKLSTKIYGATTVGPHAKVGGEVNNSIIWGYSNKGHDGFLGNSVLGKWCNLGADTNNSNLKNNYSNVKVWDYAIEDYRNTGLQFCGLIMGDHSKTGINTMLNTGTVVGLAANIFGAGFPAKFIPSFSWGGPDGFVTFKLEKAFEVAEKMMERRGITFSKEEKEVMTHIFKTTAKYR